MSYSNEQSHVASNVDSPRIPRQCRLLKAMLTSQKHGPFPVTIRNVSRLGIGGGGEFALERGERVTIELPGHQPMRGTVRWTMDRRFGIECDLPIRVADLCSAHDGQLNPIDNSPEFRIIPPPIVDTRRPGLTIGTSKPPRHGHSEWTER